MSEREEIDQQAKSIVSGKVYPDMEDGNSPSTINRVTLNNETDSLSNMDVVVVQGEADIKLDEDESKMRDAVVVRYAKAKSEGFEKRNKTRN